MRMVIDFVIALAYISIIWIVGKWTVCRIFTNTMNKSRELIAFAVGFAEMTLVSTFAYFTCGMSVRVIQFVWIALALPALADMIRRHEMKKMSFAVFGIVAGLWLLLLIPGVLGKDQYYVYRGNCCDQHIYVEEAIAMSMHPVGWYESRTREEIEAVSDILWRGYNWCVNDRPSAGLMIAVMRGYTDGEIYWVVHLYRVFVWAMIITSMLYLFCVVLEIRKEEDKEQSIWQKLLWLAVSGLYCMGFWGQIQFDIDAVSQMSSIAVFIALTALFYQYLRAVFVGDECRIRYYAVIVLLSAAGLVMYLENALVHGVLYLAAGISLLVYTKRKISGKQILALAGIPVMAMGVLVLSNYRVLSFFRGQIQTSFSDVRQTWAEYFNKWWLGIHGVDDGRITGPVSKAINGIVSASGMYNMTVNYERYYGFLAIALTGVVILIALLILFCLIRPVFSRQKESVWFLWSMVLVGAVIIAGMCVCGKHWSAGKFLYYISPYLYTFYCLPVLDVRNCRGMIEKMALCLAGLMLLSNSGMVLAKCRDVKVNWACIGYRGTYPSDMIPGLKVAAEFTFDTDDLEGAECVAIGDLSMVSDYQLYLEYVKVKLTCAEILYTAEKDVDFAGNAIDASERRTLEGKCAVLWAVKNADDRYEIEIVTD